MLISLSLILFCGIISIIFARKMKIPEIIPMLVSGIIIGPHMLNLVTEEIISISDDLRNFALIIILLKAGFTLNIGDLKSVGKNAFMMSFLPASFEIIAYMFLAPLFFNLNTTEAILMGCTLAAVSPAVVVPFMVRFIDEGYGTKKSIPQMILAGASLDDVYVIVLFTSFLSVLKGNKFSALSLLSIPVSIVSACLTGVLLGYIVFFLLKNLLRKGEISKSLLIVIILQLAFFTIFLEKALSHYFKMSSLLCIIVLALTLQKKLDKKHVVEISNSLSGIWTFAKILLFVLVGLKVDIAYSLNAGINVVVIILLAIVIRSFGVLLSLRGLKFTKKEKLFCIFSYLPKATVQAAIGSVALSEGLKCGNIILTVAVCAILITAPLGSFLIERTHKNFLN